MESTTTNNNNNHMFLCEFKELRKELSAMKKRIVQLEESHEKQQKRLDILESENHTLKTQLNNLNDDKAVESILKRKRTEKEEETESKTTSVSTPVSVGNTKTKTNNNYNDDEKAVVIRQHDNGDSFDSLSDDLLHKIVELEGNCYSKFGSINKRCRNIYDVQEYKLKKQTCVFGYGTVDMMLEYYLQKRRENKLGNVVRCDIAAAMIWYNRVDAIDWIIQLGDSYLLEWVCSFAASYGRINILSRVFLKSNLTMLDQFDDSQLCYNAAKYDKLETLKWLRNHGAECDADTFYIAREYGNDEIVQYLRAEGCPEEDDDVDGESIVSLQLGSDDEDGDY